MRSGLRIGIDARALTGRFTGDRTYWKNLLRVLPGLDASHTYLLYSRLPIEAGELPELANVQYRVVPAASDRVWTLFSLGRALRQDKCDLVHVQYTIPPAAPCPVVTTIHDISFRLHPEWFPRRDRLLLNLTIPAAMRSAARIITDSESSREDILRAYPVAPEKVVTTRLGLPQEFVAQAQEPDPSAAQENARNLAKMRYDLDSPFILALGVLQPRKNLRMLAEAFGKAKAKYGLPHRLALAGKAGWATEQDTLRQAAALNGGETAARDVVFPGYVADEDLPHLYRACDVFAYPSLYEGFGLPPLEALACAAPVLVSDAPPMPDNVGDAALVAPATDVEAWAQALGRICTEPELRADLSERGPRRALQFRWETTAQQTLDVYQSVLSLP